MTSRSDAARSRNRYSQDHDVHHELSVRDLLRGMLGGPTHAGCRDCEWEHAWCLVVVAVILVLPGDSLSLTAYSTFDKLGLGEEMWAFVFGAVGVMRLTALKINGRKPQTPIFRMVGAAVGCLLWGNLTIQVAVASASFLHAVPPAVGVFLVLTLSEARSFARARYDVRYLR